MADLIDKSVLHQPDSVMQALAARPGTPRPELRFCRRLSNGSNGHVPGFYMARTIERQGLLPQLLSAIDDPMAFFLLYQRAARRDKTHPPVCSGASVAYLKTRQKKYVAPARRAAARALAP